MDRKDILDMALATWLSDYGVETLLHGGEVEMDLENLESFANLVANRCGGDTANQIAGAVAAYTRDTERHRIALMIEQMGIEGYGTLAIAAAVRAGSHMSQH